MSIARDVTTVGAATLTSRLLGFLRDAGVAALLGAGRNIDGQGGIRVEAVLFRDQIELH